MFLDEANDDDMLKVEGVDLLCLGDSGGIVFPAGAFSVIVIFGEGDKDDADAAFSLFKWFNSVVSASIFSEASTSKPWAMSNSFSRYSLYTYLREKKKKKKNRYLYIFFASMYVMCM